MTRNPVRPIRQQAVVRIGIADDFPQWREKTREILEVRPEWQVIFEAEDGLEAVQKCMELCPDVVILDVGMPRLNGIDAAGKIHQLCPNVIIVFLTQDTDVDVKRLALTKGADEYLLKINVESALVPALARCLAARTARL